MKEKEYIEDDVRKKVKTISELEKISKGLREKGKIIVHCHGVFDLMHPGHIKYFEASKREGDVLIVTLTPDKYVGKGPGRPVFNQHLRAESIASLYCVDYVAVNEWPTAVETIKKIKPHVYAKGSDYAAPETDITGGIYHEKDAIESVGGKIHFTSEITFSSTELLNKYFDVYPDEAREFFEEFRKRFSASDIIERLNAVKGMKVLVIGDTIIDEYHYCKAMGKSPKETIISTKYVSEERFAGGVLACANHIAGFCNNVYLITCLGRIDAKEDYILDHLKPNIETKFFYRDDTCTVVKRRFVDPAFLTKMFEMSFLEDHPLPEKISREVCDYLKDVAQNYDLVLMADFGHGFIDDNIIDVICKKAKFLSVNTQTNSANIGFNLITKYPRADYVCIDEPEIRLAAHDKFGDIKDIITEIKNKVNAKKITVTRGHLGSMTYSEEGGFHEIPVFSKKIVDRVGAGDAFLSITSPVVAAGSPMDVIGFIGNAVGALAIGIVCNRSSVEPVPLFKFITSLLK
ncbi:MAG: adenylyltransferase/cytidyltransferase family protein [Nitrospirae bacterium]|nr:adenylyltransferase/cytidyltransferase family protein [Nitrospirota bacterium]